jgi:hypothetical protein
MKFSDSKIFLKKSFFSLFLLLLTLMLSCSQDEGIGGSSAILGVLTERVYSEDLVVLLSEQPAKKEDVFLLFGTDNFVGADTETSFTGHFKFDYLWHGNYTLFYYSIDTLGGLNERKEVVIPVKVGKNQTVDLQNIYLISTRKWDEGTAKIKGKLFMRNYKNSSVWPNMILKDISPAQEFELYITYGNHTFYDERIRTQEDGSFEFRNLIRGEYKIVYYSDDLQGGTAKIPVSININIDTDGMVFTFAENLYTNKL